MDTLDQPVVKKRIGASVNAYLVLRQGNSVLLQLRENTGYGDGLWCFMAGHVENDESATLGMIREAKEEIGIEIFPADLKVVHVMHQKTNRFNINVFFECSSWKGEIKNMEPEKCGGLKFFLLDSLPVNIVLNTEIALKCISKGEFYSELGWD